MKSYIDEAAACPKPALGSSGEIKRPTKEQVRSWMAERLARPVPLPSLEQIRRDLGWTVAEALEA
ncbi:hypothetical protein [Janthinobacterium sp. 17J80-10]|uniref:hypothetical protein n=1 Tax=Janthinobacterium sp. 17J80-10 TaxID=2497863 RepID=UPI0010057773|nr:hypothetical protein [Janthinobacterium sp. 17J80-10]QAU35020.1 hypothetical protein EKL02_12980 [Janthinobacterium sp. 17J80-10]